MEIVSYGNQIRCGKYELYLKFSSAANFFSDDTFAFIVDTRVGAGPLNIVLEGTTLYSVCSLEICNDYFYLNNERISFNKATQYDSNIHIDGIDRIKFRSNLQYLEDALIQYSPPKSLAFLVDNRRKKEFTSSFDLAIVDRFEKGLKELLIGDYKTGVETMKGLGYGLTPSGDDFVSGFLISLQVSQQILKTDFSQIIDIVHRAAKGSNSFTNIFLDCAVHGYVSEKFKKLIYALCYSDKKNIVYCTRQLLTVGATSGADQTVGFLFGLKRF
jgi:hypothetical protein